MPETTTNHEVRTEFTAHGEQAKRTMSGLAKESDSLAGKFNRLSTTVAGFGGLAAAGIGAFSLAKAVEDTEKYLGSVKRIHELTGMTVTSTDGMLDAMKQYGISAEGAEGIMMRLSRQSAKMEMGMAGGQRGVGFMAREMRALGVDIAHGPEKALETMAASVAKGRVDASKLAFAFRVPMAEAGRLMHLLEKGPEGVKDAIAELAKTGTALTQADIDVYSRIDSAKHKIQAGWERIQITVVKEVMPAIEAMLGEVTKQLPHWTEKAKEFGKWLNEHLATGLATVVKIGKVLVANAALQKLSGAAGIGAEGRGMGILDMTKAAPGWLKKTFYQGGQTGFAEQAGTSLLGPALGNAITGTAKLATAGGLLYLAGMSAERVFRNVNGLGDYMEISWAHAEVAIAQADAAMSAAVDSMFTGGGGTELSIRDFPALAIAGLGRVFTYLLAEIEMTGVFIQTTYENIMAMLPGGSGERHSAWAAGRSKFYEVMDEADAAMAAKEQEINDRRMARDQARVRHGLGLDVPAERGGTNYDFRGSTFRIEQNFAEGMEPDRVAVAFTNDIAKLGERRLQSNFQPLFSTKG